MPGHQNEDIRKQIADNQALIESFNQMEAKLQQDLADGFLLALGFSIPSALDCDVYQSDLALKYTSELQIDEFEDGARQLLNAAFSGDMAEVANKALSVVSVGVKDIFGGLTITQTCKGNAAKVTHNGKKYFTACYASTAYCSSKVWFTQTDFNIAKYVIVVMEDTKAAKNLAPGLTVDHLPKLPEI